MCLVRPALFAQLFGGESLIPCDLLFLQLLSDQNNPLSLPEEPQDGSKLWVPCIFWFPFIGFLLLATVVGQERTLRSKDTGNKEVKIKAD